MAGWGAAAGVAAGAVRGAGLGLVETERAHAGDVRGVDRGGDGDDLDASTGGGACGHEEGGVIIGGGDRQSLWVVATASCRGLLAACGIVMEGFTEIRLKVEDVVLVQGDKEGVDFRIGQDREWHFNRWKGWPILRG